MNFNLLFQESSTLFFDSNFRIYLFRAEFHHPMQTNTTPTQNIYLRKMEKCSLNPAQQYRIKDGLLAILYAKEFPKKMGSFISMHALSSLAC